MDWRFIMMTAGDLKKISDEKSGQVMAEKMKELEKKFLERANAGYHSMRFDEKFDYDVERELTRLGYTVEAVGGSDPRYPNEKRYYVVSWNE